MGYNEVKKTLLIILFAMIPLFIYSCVERHDKVCKVLKKVRSKNTTDTFYVDFAKEMDFYWDTLYYFGGWPSLNKIDSTLGIHFPFWTDGNFLIFIRHDKKENKKYCVYYENYMKMADKPYKGPAFINDSSLHFKLDRNNAMFKVEKKDKIYLLMHVEKK